MNSPSNYVEQADAALVVMPNGRTLLITIMTTTPLCIKERRAITA